MLDDKLEIRNVCNIKKRYFTPSHVPSQYDSDHDGKTKWHGPNLPLLLYSLARANLDVHVLESLTGGRQRQPGPFISGSTEWQAPRMLPACHHDSGTGLDKLALHASLKCGEKIALHAEYADRFTTDQ